MKRISRIAATCGLAAVALSANAAFVGDRTDFRNETIYFMMTTRFYDGDPTNNVCSWDKQDVQISKNDPDWRGDFKGVIDKLDYIKALGFTAIWITPVVQNASGEDYHGYHAMDMSNVDLRYESRREWGASQDVKFQDLINAAHEKGIKIVLDIVLQHTGNFGEATLNPLFTRSQNIKDQANVAASMIPNYERLSSNYWDQSATAQYNERWKYFKQAQYEPNNYYHHYGTGWNWDEPNRWWAQIAGDCVDLNTENDYVADYIVNCYGKFIEMGVDGFRIDTAGHIAPLTFNTQFIPKFHEIAEANRSKRLNGGDFFMFGEVCQRFQGSVVYRNQPNLSAYFYTWNSDQSLKNEFKQNSSAAWWASQVLNEGYDTPVGPMAVCEKDKQDKSRSNNALMQNGQWHQPDYSNSSGLNVIDFPVHYSFNSVGEVIQLYNQDNYYNDATYNVVYVDSHDYSPGPNDGTRFNGGTSQWAENLSWMFTFRGIPCIYYGSEVEFKKGLPIDVGGENNKTPRSESGRAYFGTYLEGSVSATDFGTYTANGNVAQTLNADLAQHIRRLNQIRAAVPALRTGQYTFDGCSANGGWAFKRATQDSYALVAVNGGATFSNVPAGTYVDLVTGQSYQGGGTITVSAPATKGQLRVLVKDWTGGKVGEDGKFIYASSPVSHGGSVEFADPGTTQYYTSDDAVGTAKVSFNPAGGSFKTETLNVTATLSESATSGSYTVNGSTTNLTPGQSKSFTIGAGMAYGESLTVTWTADEYSGSVTYKKVDPNAITNIYVTGKNGANISGANVYCWQGSTEFSGSWPGKSLSSCPTVTVDGKIFYEFTADTTEPVNVIFNQNGSQTSDITDIQGDVYFEYDGSTSANQITVNPGPSAPVITANPASGTTFTESLTVSLSVSGATDLYYTLNGQQASISSTKYSGPITLSETTTINAYAKNDQGETRKTFVYTKTDAPQNNDLVAYFDNSNSNWSSIYVYAWEKNTSNEFFGSWNDKRMNITNSTVSYNGKTLHKVTYSPTTSVPSNPMIIFHNGSGSQTGDFNWVNNHIYNSNGDTGQSFIDYSGIDGMQTLTDVKIFANNGRLVVVSPTDGTVQAVSLDGKAQTLPVLSGYNYYELPKGFYIVAGKKVIL